MPKINRVFKIMLPGALIHTVTIKGTFYFEPKQLELKLVQAGTWDEIFNVTNWQPGRKGNESV